MDVEVKIGKEYPKPQVVIYANEMTEEISEVLQRISLSSDRSILGFKDSEIFILKYDDILSIYSNNQKVFAETNKGEVAVKSRLYELEEKLVGSSFIRISNSEIVNFSKVKSLDLSISGTITLRLINGKNSFVSRRFVGKIKNYLGI